MNRIIVETACEHGWFEPHTWAYEARTCKGPTLNPRELSEFSPEATEAAGQAIHDYEDGPRTTRNLAKAALAAALEAERNRV